MERVNRLVQGWTTYVFPSRLDFLPFSSSPITTTTATTTTTTPMYQQARQSASGRRLAACNATRRAAARYFAERTTTALEAWLLAIRREQAARAAERAFVRGFAAL